MRLRSVLATAVAAVVIIVPLAHVASRTCSAGCLDPQSRQLVDAAKEVGQVFIVDTIRHGLDDPSTTDFRDGIDSDGDGDDYDGEYDYTDAEWEQLHPSSTSPSPASPEPAAPTTVPSPTEQARPAPSPRSPALTPLLLRWLAGVITLAVATFAAFAMIRKRSVKAMLLTCLMILLGWSLLGLVATLLLLLAFIWALGRAAPPNGRLGDGSQPGFYVYRLLRSDGRVMYVGKTTQRVAARVARHRDRGVPFHDFTFEAFPDRSTMEAEEARLIELLRPAYNDKFERPRT